MDQVFISTNFKDLIPQARIGIVKASVKILGPSTEFENVINSTINRAKVLLSDTSEKELLVISETRKAYKICGKEPSRYRPSAEALLKRIRTNKGLYRINNIVDTINLLSIDSHFSIGGFDEDCIVGNAVLSIGNQSPYLAIGRGELNIKHMPGMKDDKGFFGTPTSDSERTKVTGDLKNLLLVYYDFMGNENLEQSLNEAVEYLTLFCKGENIRTDIIS